MSRSRYPARQRVSYGFPPLAMPGATVLVLGSLPGVKSINACEYYANPRNAFWQIAEQHLGILPQAYAARVKKVTTRGVALWDVLAAATRSGSLDSAIEEDAVPNNFRALLHAYPTIQMICFNGTKACQLFSFFSVLTLTEQQKRIQRLTLPSTSGAHAKMSLREKAKAWEIVWKWRSELTR
jgi:TDG/mug DNA glycosylase family protein